MSSGSRMTNMPPSASAPEPNINLSREELLKLLSVFEGELQARDEVIEILKSERPNQSAIQERYGFGIVPLQALQRDAASLVVATNDHVVEKTTQNLQKIIQHQKESYKKLKQALLAAEQTNQRLGMEINEEKRKHQDYMLKSDDFVNLLEDERERLKFALKREKRISEDRENEMNQKLKKEKDEVAKLNSLSLVLVEERKQHLSDLAEHKKRVIDLKGRMKKTEIKYKESENDNKKEKDHVTQLENDLEDQTNKFYQSQEEFGIQLQEEIEKNKLLEEKVKKLKTVQRNLQNTDDQLWRIQEKLDKDEEHDLLLKEVELLRQKIKDMEESEEIYTQAQENFQDIRQKLKDEIALTRTLQSQLAELQNQAKAQTGLQRSIEDTNFRFDELQTKFELEKKKSNDMKEQLQKMKSKMTELDQYEAIVQQAEEKMNRMKERIVLLTSQKKFSDDQVLFLVEKNKQIRNESQLEKDKISGIMDKFLDESKKVLKLREELSQEKQKCSSQIASANEKLKQAKEDLSSTMAAEKANGILRRQVAMLKARLDELEAENEAKEAKLPRISKSQGQGLTEPTDLAKIAQNLQAAEERSKHLSEQLHAKTKLCEDLKKNLAQATQKNNNNIAGVALTSAENLPTVNNEPMTLPKLNMKTDLTNLSQSGLKREKGDESGSREKMGTVKKNLPTMQTKPTKVNLETASQPVGSRTSFLSSPTNKKLMSPMTSLRNSKVASANLRVTKKSPTKSNSQKPVLSKLEDSTSKDAPVRSAIKITKDGQTGNQAIKTVKQEDPQKKALTSPTKTTAVNSSSTKHKAVLTKIKSSIPSSPKISKRSRSISTTRNTTTQEMTKDSMSPTRIPKFRSKSLHQSASEPSKVKRTSPNCRKSGPPR